MYWTCIIDRQRRHIHTYIYGHTQDRTFVKAAAVSPRSNVRRHVIKHTRQDLKLRLVADLRRAHVLHQAAVKAAVGLRGVADHQSAARQLDQPGAELQGLAVFLPPGERHQVRVDLTRHHLVVADAHGGRRRLAGEPGNSLGRE